MSDPVLQALADELRAEGGLIAGVTSPQPGGTADMAVAVAGPRTEAQVDRYALLVEAIREGYLQHYAEARVLDTAADPDLGLLAGDRLYALGLAKLAELGDLEGIGILAGIISGCARAHAEERPDEAARVWGDGVAALAGSTA